MLEFVFNNHLLLATILLLLLFLVPAVLLSNHQLRNPAHPDRRKHPRPGPDRRR